MSSASISFPFLGNWSICPSNTVTLFGHTFYWYGIIIACGFLLALAYAYRRCERDFGLRQDDLTDILLFTVPLAIVGARLYYVVFYGHYETFADVINIRQGGLAIYGGIIAAALTVLAVCRFKRISPLAALDVAAFGFLIGQSVGRWGNFMNREAYGYETDIFCRMGLTLNGETIYVHPTFLYESLWNALGFLALHIFSKTRPRRFDGEYFLLYIGWYGLGRLWIEGLRTDSLYIGGTSIRVSQAIAGVTFLLSVILLTAVLRSGRCAPEKLWIHRATQLPAEEDSPSGAAQDQADKSDPDV